MKSNDNNIFELIDSLIANEMRSGIRFDNRGLPIFEKWMFCDSLPKEIVPYRHRKASVSPKDTAVCFYEPDEALYRRLEKLDATADELGDYACFIGFDLSIFSDFIKPFQDFYVSANLAIDAHLILKGNKMIPNLRADESGGHYFGLFKDAPIVCCGTLGCSKRKETRRRNEELIKSYSKSHPSQTLIQYGSKLVDVESVVHYGSFGWRNR